jgi:hypothetical protein
MAAINEDYFLQGDPDTVTQYAESLRKALPFGGEKMLMLAVLEEAVDCYKRNLLVKDRKAQNLFAETEAWISARGDDVLFSFENVCDALGLDADYLRSGLLGWKENQLARRTGHHFNDKNKGSKARRRKRFA